MSYGKQTGKTTETQGEERVFQQIWRAVKEIKYGTITIVVQDSRVIQIEKTEKLRFC